MHATKLRYTPTINSDNYYTMPVSFCQAFFRRKTRYLCTGAAIAGKTEEKGSGVRENSAVGFRRACHRRGGAV